jgi:hypothetical protein
MPQLKVRRIVGKHSGGDLWAVFIKGNPTPVVTGCSQAEARSHKEILELRYEGDNR